MIVWLPDSTSVQPIRTKADMQARLLGGTGGGADGGATRRIIESVYYQDALFQLCGCIGGIQFKNKRLNLRLHRAIKRIRQRAGFRRAYLRTAIRLHREVAHLNPILIDHPQPCEPHTRQRLCQVRTQRSSPTDRNQAGCIASKRGVTLFVKEWAIIITIIITMGCKRYIPLHLTMALFYHI